MISRAILTIGSLAAFAGVGLIWIARASIPRAVYVSELGATGMHTATVFTLALLLIAAGGVLIALTGQHPHSRIPVLGAWSIAVTIAISSVFFVVASQVSCTAGCPVPLVGVGSTFQDLVHTTAAVLGFVAGCVAMLQVGFVGRRMRVAWFSAAACSAVAVITIVGGMLSIFRTATDFGGVLEFVGTTIAVVWLAGYGLWLAWRPDAVALGAAVAAMVTPDTATDSIAPDYARPLAIKLSS